MCSIHALYPRRASDRGENPMEHLIIWLSCSASPLEKGCLWDAPSPASMTTSWLFWEYHCWTKCLWKMFGSTNILVMVKLRCAILDNSFTPAHLHVVTCSAYYQDTIHVQPCARNGFLIMIFITIDCLRGRGWDQLGEGGLCAHNSTQFHST